MLVKARVQDVGLRWCPVETKVGQVVVDVIGPRVRDAGISFRKQSTTTTRAHVRLDRPWGKES